MVDVHTQSNFTDVAVEHLSLNLMLDMDRKLFSGFVDLAIKNNGSSTLVLDSKDLTILSAAISDDGHHFHNVNFRFLAEDVVRGQALAIAITETTRIVRVTYETTDRSKGLDWLAPELTADGFPMVVTQFQAINARTFVPCQDTPGQKITYDAVIKLKSSVTDRRMRVVMAAMEREVIGDRAYRFRMTIPIPTYLIALAAGVFEERPISERVSIIAEPSIADRARDEFVDAEKMVATAEKLLGEYAWKRFDIFIMPPSFSYGGMENPTMTFIGPTVIAGDQSLVDVIAHELAHSWSGNWVTNKNWDEFWINEGTTMYIERLIVAELYGTALRDLDIVLGQQVLKSNIEEIARDPRQGPPLTRLKLCLHADFDPDDAVSHVPYEKGFNFWLALEQAYGKPAVVEFLKQYFHTHANGTMDSATLKKLIVRFAPFEGATKIDIDAWFHGDGLYPLPVVNSELIADVERVVASIGSAGDISQGADNFDTKQWSYFLCTVKNMSGAAVASLNKRFKLDEKNDEVKFNFYVLAIRAGAYEPFSKDIDAYLGRVGRIKYVSPIYEALREGGLIDEAKALYEKHRGHNNHITNGSIARRLG